MRRWVVYLRLLFYVLAYIFPCSLITAEQRVNENETSLVKDSSEDLLHAPLEERLRRFIKYSLDGPNHIGHIAIKDHSTSISQATWIYVKTALDAYKKSKPIFIILELDTPGGEVFAAQKISDALKELDIQYEIPVVTFINNWAISAGAMLAYSTRFITITKDAAMGAAEPIQAGIEGKTETASEKVNSALRQTLRIVLSFLGGIPL